MVTYRPLFCNISPSISKTVSSILSFGKHGSSAGSKTDDSKDGDPERRLQYNWPAAQGLHTPMTYQEMHAKVTKPGIHVVETAGVHITKGRPGKSASMTTCEAVTPDMSWSSKPNKNQAKSRV